MDKIRDLDRAKEFAERVNAPAVWSNKLAKAQLDVSLVTDVIKLDTQLIYALARQQAG